MVYELPEEEIRTQFHVGSIFEDAFWAPLGTKADVVFARRVVNHFTPPEKFLEILLNHTTPTGRVVFDFQPNSPASKYADGEDSQMCALRWLHSFPELLQEAVRGVKVDVSDMHVLVTDFEMDEVDRQVQELADKVGANILAARPPEYELPPPENIIKLNFWDRAEIERPAGINKTRLVNADRLRREHVKHVFDNFKQDFMERMPHRVPCTIFVSLQKKAGNITTSILQQ